MSIKQLVKAINPNGKMWAKARLLEYQRRLKNDPTECERELSSMMRLMGFESQVIVGGKRIVDFYHIAKGIVVELDGFQHYRKDGTLKAGDRRRDKFLLTHGVKRVLHISNDRVRRQPLAVLEDIRAVCQDVDVALSSELNSAERIVKRLSKRKRVWPSRKFPQRRSPTRSD